MLHPRLFAFLLCLIAYQTVLAQTTDLLSKDTDFFRQQAVLYQRWLDQDGLGGTLHVQETEVRGDSLVILYLGFYSTNIDTVFGQWDRLKADYELAGTGTSLEHTLFNKMTRFFGINPEQGQVRLFETYNLSVNPCFKVRILFQNDSIKIIEGRCKDESRIIAIRASDLSIANKKNSTATFKKMNTKKAVFDRLIPFLQQRYTQQQCDLRWPKFDLQSSSEELHFVVNDLCKEVLYDESNPWWCEVLKSWSCEGCKNCIKRERLDVHIYYEATAEGFRLKTDIAASYGSGWYDKPRDNGYHVLDLDYPQYLKLYADKLSKEIFDFLTKP